jgi:hypothetical protein
MYKTAPKEVIEARPAAIRFANEIGTFANKKWSNGAQMAGLLGALTLQNILVSIVLKLHPPGSLDGLIMLQGFYDGIWQDVEERWNQEDLKIRRQRGEI